tara:strand:- start:391 stop:702 length:312 start_codon:yes stop_codon:yes gene_type:complete
MKLLTKELEKKLIRQAEKNEFISDPSEDFAHVKFFDPTGYWTWYASEYDPQTKTFYGLVDGHEKEFGYFSLKELEELKLPMGLKIERDLYFESTLLSELYRGK